MCSGLGRERVEDRNIGIQAGPSIFASLMMNLLNIFWLGMYCSSGIGSIN